MSFRLWTIFYVFALFASAMATFWAGGNFCCGWCPRILVMDLVWQKAASDAGGSARGSSDPGYACRIVPAGCADGARTSRTGICRNNLKLLAIALASYKEAKGTLPPAYLTDASGKPILSWRVAILPFMEISGLYSSIDLSKAWDDPANRSVTATLQYYLQCPSGHSDGATTEYFAIVGPQTAWPGARGRSISVSGDGTSKTILLIECHSKAVNWAEPRDLTFDEAVDLLSNPVPRDDGHFVNNGFFYKSGRGRFVAFADGSVLFLKRPLDRKLAAALLTINGGESINFAALETAIEATLDYAKCYISAVFVMLSLLPAISARKHWRKLACDA